MPTGGAAPRPRPPPAAACPAGAAPRPAAACARSRRRLSRRERVDRDLNRRRQHLRACRRAVRLQDERGDVDVLLLAQPAGPRRRHRELHERQQFARRSAAPPAHELRARQRRGVARSFEIRKMTTRALRLVRRPARGGLCSRIRAGRSCGPCPATSARLPVMTAAAASVSVFISISIPRGCPLVLFRWRFRCRAFLRGGP